MATKGKAYATRTSGNVYCVTYERSKAMDRDVSGEYLGRLVRAGYEVVCDNGGYGDPRSRHEVGRLVNGEVTWAPQS
jgi:hypothetical protein